MVTNLAVNHTPGHLAEETADAYSADRYGKVPASALAKFLDSFGDKLGAEVKALTDETFGEEDRQRLADCAPELLEALEAICEAYGCECVDEAHAPKGHCAMCQGRAVIRKAKGEL